jgi:hypothetical protein
MVIKIVVMSKLKPEQSHKDCAITEQISTHFYLF